MLDGMRDAALEHHEGGPVFMDLAFTPTPFRFTQSAGSPAEPLRAAASALEACGLSPETHLSVEVVARPHEWPWDVSGLDTSDPALACSRDVLSRLALEDSLMTGGRRVIVMQATLSDLSREPATQPTSNLCEGRRTTVVSGGADDDRPGFIKALGVPQERTDVLKTSFVDAAGVALALSCPDPEPLTVVEATWRDGQLSSVVSSPTSPCVEDRATAVLDPVPAGMENMDSVRCSLEVPLQPVAP